MLRARQSRQKPPQHGPKPQRFRISRANSGREARLKYHNPQKRSETRAGPEAHARLDCGHREKGREPDNFLTEA
jgi:hypothetical protein